MSDQLPAWLPDRSALNSLSIHDARYLDHQWRLAGGAPRDTSWITMETIGAPFWPVGLAIGLVVVATLIAVVLTAL